MDIIQEIAHQAAFDLYKQTVEQLIKHGIDPTLKNVVWFESLHDIVCEKVDENGQIKFITSMVPKKGRRFEKALFKGCNFYGDEDDNL